MACAHAPPSYRRNATAEWFLLQQGPLNHTLTRGCEAAAAARLRLWSVPAAATATAAAAAVQQREGLERCERLQRLLPGGHVEVGAAAQTRGVGCRVGVEHERCWIPARGARDATNIQCGTKRGAAAALAGNVRLSLVLPCGIRVEEVQQAALLQKPAAADYAQQRRRVPVLQHWQLSASHTHKHNKARGCKWREGGGGAECSPTVYLGTWDEEWQCVGL